MISGRTRESRGGTGLTKRAGSEEGREGEEKRGGVPTGNRCCWDAANMSLNAAKAVKRARWGGEGTGNPGTSEPPRPAPSICSPGFVPLFSSTSRFPVPVASRGKWRRAYTCVANSFGWRLGRLEFVSSVKGACFACARGKRAMAGRLPGDGLGVRLPPAEQEKRDGADC